MAIGLTYTLPPGASETGGATSGVAVGIGGAVTGAGGVTGDGGGAGAEETVLAVSAGDESSLKSLNAATSDSSSTIIQTNLPKKIS